MASIHIQGFSIPRVCLCVYVCVCVYVYVCVLAIEFVLGGAGSRCSHSWHQATLSTLLPISVWEHNGRSGKTIQAQEQGTIVQATHYLWKEKYSKMQPAEIEIKGFFFSLASLHSTCEC